MAVADLTPEAGERLAKELKGLRSRLKEVEAERAIWNDAKWNSLTSRAKALHEKAFTTNEGDPDYRSLASLKYHDGEKEREVLVPKGDTLHRFRQDVETGALPAVSWIVAPENFSDHPGAAWYGAWYVSEVLDILTKDPEVWKKTIFVLCYDENDGYFDHHPPFTAPHPDRPETGKASVGIDTSVDWAHAHGRDHSIGLGFRVPLVVASPWSRGGCVNSQVFDHTSVLRLLEVWLAGKGKPVREENISDWRRTVCGDLTTTFRPYDGETIVLPKPLDRDATVESIHAAKFKSPPKGGKALSKEEIATVEVGILQEGGTRPACPLPYELAVNAVLDPNGLTLTMEAKDKAFGPHALGAPFNAYSYGNETKVRSYAVKAGDAVRDLWPVEGAYHVRIDGPNGFMREFRGEGDAAIAVRVEQTKDRLHVSLSNPRPTPIEVEVRDESYGSGARRQKLEARQGASVAVDTAKSHGWYDFTVRAGNQVYRYAGHAETGKWSVTDPAMGGIPA